MIYDPGSYLVKGEEIREVIEKIKPGDILVRGYKNYLDGYFIPGFFSHAGFYAGEITDQHAVFIDNTLGKAHFKTGTQMVIHSMAEGVFMEDIINFCKCDYMVILRMPEKITTSNSNFDNLDISKFFEKEIEIFNLLKSGKTIECKNIYPTLIETALNQLGKGYDFNFDFSNTQNQSCTEFVSICYRSLIPYHQIVPKERKVLVTKKTIIMPDDYVSKKLSIAWKSKSVKQELIEKLEAKS